MADDRSALRAIFRCLVVGDSQNLRAGLALDEIDRAAQDEAAVDGTGSRRLFGSRPGCIRQAEAKLEQPRLPSRALGKIVAPRCADRCGCWQFRPARRDRPPARAARRSSPRLASSVASRISSTRSIGRRRDRHLPLLQGAKEFGQHLVKQAPLGERDPCARAARVLPAVRGDTAPKAKIDRDSRRSSAARRPSRGARPAAATGETAASRR